jgi:hypothetical protein
VARPTPTAVVHLIWGPLGIAPFDAFLTSYERYGAGLEHDLVLLYNGVADLGPYRLRAGNVRASEIVLGEPCFDLAAYVTVARTLEHERICFVNSYSEITTDGWLQLLATALDDPNVGAAGATGSWGSPLSYNLFQLGLGGPYTRAFAGRRAARDAFDALSGGRRRDAVSHWLHTAVRTVRHGRGTGLFPAVHLRTNAFLVDRAHWLTLTNAPAGTKWDTYRLESGRRSITTQLCAADTPPVVVDARGVARRPEDWHRGNVLFQADQEDLIVADNVTRRYASATPVQREVLSAFAWGDKARPHG